MLLPTLLGELDDQVLGCFCAPKRGVGAYDPLVCHGQILLELLEHRRKKIAERQAERTPKKLYISPEARYPEIPTKA